MAGRLNDHDLLARLVAFDTTSANSNLELLEFVCDYVDRPGVRFEQIPSADGRKANLVAWVGPEAGEAREGLVLSGHMDVVPACEDGWRSDPFSLTEVDGTLVGRGACDMKGFIAIALNRFSVASNQPLRAPLALLLTYDEEVGTLGARHLVEAWTPSEPLPRRTIIGEPTGLRAVRMHKGHLTARITVAGSAAHSGVPHLGVNAIEAAGPIIVALREFRKELEAERSPISDHFPEVPYVPFNVAVVEGGIAANVVPDRCAIEIGTRLLPGMDSAAFTDRLREVIENAGRGRAFGFEVLTDSPPLIVDESVDLHRDLCAAVDQHGSASIPFATDGGWLQTIGLDCVVFGPGSIEVAHRANEFLPIEEMDRGGALIGGAIERWCRIAEIA